MVERQFLFDGSGFCESIMKQEGVAIGAEDEGNVERSGVIQSLLHSTADAVVIVFGFDERERHVRFAGQQEGLSNTRCKPNAKEI